MKRYWEVTYHLDGYITRRVLAGDADEARALAWPHVRNGLPTAEWDTIELDTPPIALDLCPSCEWHGYVGSPPDNYGGCEECGGDFMTGKRGTGKVGAPCAD